MLFPKMADVHRINESGQQASIHQSDTNWDQQGHHTRKQASMFLPVLAQSSDSWVFHWQVKAESAAVTCLNRLFCSPHSVGK